MSNRIVRHALTPFGVLVLLLFGLAAGCGSKGGTSSSTNQTAVDATPTAGAIGSRP